MGNAKGGNVDSCSRIKDKVRRIWKVYFEYLNSIDTEEEVAV